MLIKLKCLMLDLEDLLLCLFILDHNFRTRNARKSIKVSKDRDHSLVSNEDFSELLPSSSWAQVWYQQPKSAKNLSYL